MKRLALLVLALGILAAACGDDGSTFTTPTGSSTTGGTEPTSTTEPGTTTTTTEPPPSTTDTSTTTSTSTTTTSTTTTTAPETVYLVDTTDFFPDPFPGSGGAHGSGCVTPGFDALPNGVWFGFAEGVGGGNITFDLACFYTGPAACDAQIEDGFAADADECIDFWVRNNVATTFSVPLAAGARVWYVDMTSGDVTSPAEIPLADWPTPDSFQDCPGDYCSVWLYVNGGRITGIVEQYLP
jgi:hypothetical protein